MPESSPPAPLTLDDVARRLVWWKPPAEALADSGRFLAQVMTFGTIDDLSVVRQRFTDDDLRAVPFHAPPGVFDPRSRAYWHLALDLGEAPALPRPQFPAA